MTNTDHQSTVANCSEKSAFTVWLGRALKTCHDDAIHEPIPAKLLDLLPPPKQG